MNAMPPIVCGTLLAAMMAAGVSHYWSVENFVGNYPTTPAVRLIPMDSTIPVSDAPAEKQKTPDQQPELANLPHRPEEPATLEVMREMILEIRKLRTDNQNLTDQIGETNRDVMKMQFQIDTHSQSFRPLPTSDQRDDRSQMYDDDLPGVLPPRAEPVYPIGD